MLKHPGTLFGESDQERFKRLQQIEERSGNDYKKLIKDETARTFMPEDEEVELLKFMKEQEKLLKE